MWNIIILYCFGIINLGLAITNYFCVLTNKKGAFTYIHGYLCCLMSGFCLIYATCLLLIYLGV